MRCILVARTTHDCQKCQALSLKFRRKYKGSLKNEADIVPQMSIRGGCKFDGIRSLIYSKYFRHPKN